MFDYLVIKDGIPMILIDVISLLTDFKYGTDTVMQRLFQERYWDYSGNCFNLNGYICPLCSSGWQCLIYRMMPAGKVIRQSGLLIVRNMVTNKKKCCKI